MDDIRERTEAEIDRINDLLNEANVSERRRAALQGLIEHTAYMRVKLDDTREVIRNSDVCIPYDNGGGQTGIRENPLFKGYESLFKSYLAGMIKILDALPSERAIVEEIVEVEKPKTILELVRDNKRTG